MAFHIGTVRAGAFCSLLSVALCAVSPHPQMEVRDAKQATLLHAEGIPKFAEVTPHLYRGGQPTDKAFDDLKKMGVDVIVDMRSGNRSHEKEVVTKLGMEYMQLSWHCPFPHDKPFAEFLKIIETHPEKKIMVHCRLGDDRTGMAVAAYRMAEQDWSAKEAMDEMHDFGFRGVHYLICPGLAGYEKSFPKRLKNNKAFQELRKAEPRSER